VYIEQKQTSTYGDIGV